MFPSGKVIQGIQQSHNEKQKTNSVKGSLWTASQMVRRQLGEGEAESVEVNVNYTKESGTRRKNFMQQEIMAVHCLPSTGRSSKDCHVNKERG